MGRLYDTQYVIKTETKENADKILEALDEAGWASDLDSSYDPSDKTLFCDGQVSLFAMDGPDAHKAIVEIVKGVDPNAKVRTKWHDAEEWTWDDDLGDNAEE